MSPLESRLKEQARALDFALVGIARAGEADDFARLREWLDRGYAGEMAYMERHAAARRHPAAVLPDVRSVVMVGMEYLAGIGYRVSGIGEEPPPKPDTR
jgi:epoxyqueuosine reductase